MRQVIRGDQAAVLLDVRSQLPGDFAMIEVVGMGGDALEGLRQLRLAEDFPFAVKAAVALKDAPRFGKLR